MHKILIKILVNFVKIKAKRRRIDQVSQKKYKPKERLKIVLEGMKENIRIIELCNKYGISQVTYYKWKDRLLEEGSRIFEYGAIDAQKKRLEKENSQLKETIGELTFELKKTIGEKTKS